METNKKNIAFKETMHEVKIIDERELLDHADTEAFWRICPLEGESPIVNAEYTLWWNGGLSITTPCKVNLLTKQVFAITDPEVKIDVLGTPDEEYVSFFGMEADVYERKLLDHADIEALVFDGYWH